MNKLIRNFACAALIMILAACTQPTTSPPPIVDPLYITASSLEELTQRADLVVIGSIRAKAEHFNGARDPSNPSKPATNIYILSQVYLLDVEQVLKGEQIKQARIVQAEAFIPLSDGRTEQGLSAKDLDTARQNYEFAPITTNRKYLMFLKASTDLQNNPVYVGVLQPWRFDLSNSNSAEAETPLNKAAIKFQAGSPAEAKAKVERAVREGVAINALASPLPTPKR